MSKFESLVLENPIRAFELFAHAVTVTKPKDNYRLVYDDLSQDEIIFSDIKDGFMRRNYLLKRYSIDDVTLKIVHTEGDNEGDGEYSEKVFGFFNEKDIPLAYIKIEGSYQSYDGTSWYDSLYIVNPVEKTIIVYE